MGVLKRICGWWREFWGSDVDWTAGIDSHQWDNKVEILRRLSA